MRASSALATLGLSVWVCSCFADGPQVSDESGGGSTTGEPVCNDGAVTCPCYGNGTCDAGLTCQPDVVLCIPEDCMPGTLNCTCDQGGCVAAGTECIDGLCQVPPASDDGGTTMMSTTDTMSADATATSADTGTDDATDSTGTPECPTEAFARDGCARVVFVLGPVTTWSPGAGPEAADTACDISAMAAGLPGNYRAYLATEGQPAMQRVGVASGDGWLYAKPPATALEVVAHDGGEFAFSGPGLMSALDRYADGSMVDANCATNFVYTGVDATGSTGMTCGDWLEPTAQADAGNPLSPVGEQWQAGCGQIDCLNPGRVYCVQHVVD